MTDETRSKVKWWLTNVVPSVITVCTVLGGVAVFINERAEARANAVRDLAAVTQEQVKIRAEVEALRRALTEHVQQNIAFEKLYLTAHQELITDRERALGEIKERLARMETQLSYLAKQAGWKGGEP